MHALLGYHLGTYESKIDLGPNERSSKIDTRLMLWFNSKVLLKALDTIGNYSKNCLHKDLLGNKQCRVC